MKKGTWIVFAALFYLVSCGPRTASDQQAALENTDEAGLQVSGLTSAERAFMDKLSGLCGQSFRGHEVFMAQGRESWADKDFVMHVVLCEAEKVHIPFHLDDDTSRTWMFLIEDGRLRFRHDHRHPDGTPEDLSLYGGYADGTGTPFVQYFPADQYTIDLLGDTLNRQWNILMDEQLTTFSYQLQYRGEVVFQADFDLTRPL